MTLFVPATTTTTTMAKLNGLRKPRLRKEVVDFCRRLSQGRGGGGGTGIAAVSTTGQQQGEDKSSIYQCQAKKEEQEDPVLLSSIKGNEN